MKFDRLLNGNVYKIFFENSYIQIFQSKLLAFNGKANELSKDIWYDSFKPVICNVIG